MINNKQKGFTLIEIMVASAMGLFLMLAMTTLFINNKVLSTTQNNSTKIQDDSNFSLFLMSNDISLAGFRGCSSGNVSVSDGTKFYNVAGTATYFNSNTFIQGFQGSGSTFSPALPAAVSGLSPTPSPKGDVLTIRTTTGEAARLTEDMASATSVLKLSSVVGFTSASNAIISNCYSTSLFKVSLISGLNITPTASLTATFPVGSQVFPYDTITYYLGSNEILYKVINGGVAQPIAYNVEKFSVLYGVDTDANQNANRYVFAPLVANFNQVVSVRLGLVIKSSNTNTTGTGKSTYSYKFNGITYTPNDGKLRRSYYTTIALRNMLL